MNSKGYTFIGWIVWQLGRRLMARQIAQNRVKLGAAGLVALVLIGGVFAAKAGLTDDDD
jgi:hypothetical protein